MCCDSAHLQCMKRLINALWANTVSVLLIFLGLSADQKCSFYCRQTNTTVCDWLQLSDAPTQRNTKVQLLQFIYMKQNIIIFKSVIKREFFSMSTCFGQIRKRAVVCYVYEPIPSWIRHAGWFRRLEFWVSGWRLCQRHSQCQTTVTEAAMKGLHTDDGVTVWRCVCCSVANTAGILPPPSAVWDSFKHGVKRTSAVVFSRAFTSHRPDVYCVVKQERLCF